MIKIALPKGAVQNQVKNHLAACGIDFSGYQKDARAYASGASGEQNLFSKQFREKDIPIQVSIGNYDLGLCSSYWVMEHLAQYPKAAIINLRTLDIPSGYLYVCCAASEPEGSAGEVLARMAARGPIRIATQFPGLAEEFALRLRLPDFRIFALWGAAEAYHPEGAELALLCANNEGFISANGLRIVEQILESRVSLIANRALFETKDLTPILNKLCQ